MVLCLLPTKTVAYMLSSSLTAGKFAARVPSKLGLSIFEREKKAFIIQAMIDQRLDSTSKIRESMTLTDCQKARLWRKDLSIRA